MTHFILIPANNLILILLNMFFPTRIVCCIDLRGWSTRSTSIKVFFIAFLPPLVFFLLFPILVRGFCYFRGIIWKLMLLGFWLKLFGFRDFSIVCFVQTCMHWTIFIRATLVHIMANGWWLMVDCIFTFAWALIIFLINSL